MSVIKPTPSSLPSGRVFQMNDLDAQSRARMEEARAEAARIVAEARAEAARLVAAAESEKNSAAERGLAQGLEAGHVKGLAEGREAGLLEARAAHAAASARVQAAVAALEAALADAGRRAVADAEAGVLRLAVAMARVIVKREVQVDEAAVRGNVKAALWLVAKRTGVEVRVNPGDRAAIERYLPDLCARMEGLEIGKLVADESVSRGGCRVVTPEGTVDADTAVMLSEFERVLLG